jgi:hypothetical protein
MELEELEIHKPCASCGELIAEGLTPSYELDEQIVLCWACAIERGGRYDEESDRWVVPPDTRDLVKDEERA